MVRAQEGEQKERNPIYLFRLDFLFLHTSHILQGISSTFPLQDSTPVNHYYSEKGVQLGVQHFKKGVHTLFTILLPFNTNHL